MSLQSLLSRLILLCVGPLVLLAVFLAVAGVMAKQEDRDLKAANLVNNFAAVTDQHLQARISALHMLAASPLVDHPARWPDLYREAQGFYQGFGSHVVFADPEMHMLFNTRAPFGAKLPLLPSPKGHAAAPTALATGKPAVGDVFFGPIAREPLVAIVVPAIRAGEPRFLLLTIFATRQFQELLDRAALPDGWSLTLRDGRGEAIARRMPAGFDPETDVDDSGRSIVKSAFSPWSVVLEIPRDIYRRPLIEAAAALGLAILGVTLVSLLGGILAGRRLRKAVASLVTAPSPGAPSPDIEEIAAVHRLLGESSAKRQLFEQELQESEDRYRSFFEQSIDAVLLTATDGRILQANPEACRIFGRTEEEIRRLGRAGLMDMADPRLPAALEERQRTGRFQGELNMVRKDGATFPAEISSAVFKDRDGSLRTTMIIRDMTERREAERARRESEERYRNILTVAPVGIAVHQRGKVVFTNPAGLRLLGAESYNQIIGKDITAIIHPDCLESSRNRIERLMAGEQGLYPAEDQYVRLDGTTIAVEVIATLLTYNNEPAVQVIVTDITERKWAEEELRKYRDHLEDLVQERTNELAAANLRLQELDRLKSMFIASMSHELRTPLNSIIGFTGIIMMGMSGPLTEVQRKQLGMVKNSANHLLELINDVIDVSKIESGKTDLSISTFDLAALAEEVRESVALAAANKGLKLELHTDGEIMVASDRRRVRQILVNLVSNAIKFTPTGGVEIFLTGDEPAQNTALSGTDGKERTRGVSPVPASGGLPIDAGEMWQRLPELLTDGIRVTVRDTGVGIAREDMEKLFEAFSRIYIKDRPFVEGTGLGLYLSRRLAALLGGAITAASEPGRGTAFTLHLPVTFRGVAG